MEQPLRIFVCVTVLLLAGCSGFLTDPSDTTTTSEPTVTDTSASTETAASTSTETGTPTATPVPTATPEPVDPDNPYNTRTISVSLDSSEVGSERRLAAVSALRYWENHSEAYAGYPVEFELVPVAEESRITIRFHDPPIDCGSPDDQTSGCEVTDSTHQGWESRIKLLSTEMTHITEQIAIHEVGHALGLNHSNAPHEYMNATYSQGLYRQHVHVYMEHQDNRLTPELEDQITRAFEFYTDTDHLNEDQQLSWERVDQSTAADVIVEYRDSGPDCFEDGNGSCWLFDSDNRHHLVIEGIDTDAVGWHVASQIAPYRFEEGEIPHFLTGDADYFVRRGGWDN